MDLTFPGSVDTSVPRRAERVLERLRKDGFAETPTGVFHGFRESSRDTTPDRPAPGR